MSDAAPLRIELPDEAATIRLAEDLAIKLRIGDVVALKGDLGAGKTTLARALIRAVADDAELDVPSPTFTIVQTYAARLPVAHFDLYRLGSPEELDEIGLDEAISENAVLIEWPERAGGHLPFHRLTITLDMLGSGRVAILDGDDDWMARLQRTSAIRGFLDRSGWGDGHRRHLQGDASTRAYERIHTLAGASAVLMDDPGRGRGWMVRGKPYDEIAHRATDVRPFVAMNEAIRAAGLSAPAILAAELPAGLLLLEDLGTHGLLRADEPVFERYAVAVEALAHLHSSARADVLPLPDGSFHTIPPFDAEAVAIEVDLLPRWYASYITKAPLSAEAESAFVKVWDDLFPIFDKAEKGWLLRDFHSPNLLWLAEREGIERVGILDHQDAMIGASAYDVASLGQDVRVTVERGFEAALKAHYITKRSEQGPFDLAGFEQAYAISGAQRTTKVLGGFARLAASVAEHKYLRHIPRVRAYLKRNLEHPVLSDLALWYDRYLPLDD